MDGKGISPDNSSELAIHVAMVTLMVVLSLETKLVATSPIPSLNLCNNGNLVKMADST